MNISDIIFKEELTFLKSICFLTDEDAKKIIGAVYPNKNVELEGLRFSFVRNNFNEKGYVILEISFRLTGVKFSDKITRTIEIFEQSGRVFQSYIGASNEFTPSLDFQDTLFKTLKELNYNIKNPNQ